MRMVRLFLHFEFNLTIQGFDFWLDIHNKWVKELVKIKKDIKKYHDNSDKRRK